MIQLHFDAKQMKIGETVGVLHSITWNYTKYANMEGFHRDSHIWTTILQPPCKVVTILQVCEHLVWNSTALWQPLKVAVVQYSNFHTCNYLSALTLWHGAPVSSH